MSEERRLPEVGRYLYCVTEAGGGPLGKIGIEGGEVFPVNYKEVAGVVSPVLFKEVEANLPTILVHQQVVEACRSKATTLPVRFGVIFKSEAGVKEMLSKSYEDYRAKLTKLKDKEEFGAKVILDDAGLQKIKAQVETESEEIGKLRKAASKAGKGTAYLLNIKVDEALRTETAKKIDEMSRSIQAELARGASESAILKAEHEQIVLNAAYLVDRARREEFQAWAAKVKRKFEREGLSIHLSGPWAPYSFC
jgi:hypothetical protein